MGSRPRASLTRDEILAISERVHTFSYRGVSIRTIEHNDQRWLVFADVCRALGYKNSNDQSKKMRPEETCRLEIGLKNTLAVCINKAGLLAFALFSQKPEAEAFRVWANEQVFCAAPREEPFDTDEFLRLVSRLSLSKRKELLTLLRKLVAQERKEVAK